MPGGAPGRHPRLRLESNSTPAGDGFPDVEAAWLVPGSYRFACGDTSLSNDGFCSPQSSLTVRGQRRSLAAAMPRAVVIDTGVCRDVPRIMTLLLPRTVRQLNPLVPESMTLRP